MKLKVLSLALGLGAMTLVSCNQTGSRNVALNNQIDSVSYSIGVNFGTNLKKSKITEFNEAAILDGIYAVINEDSLKIDLRESGKVINTYIRDLQAKVGEENLAKGEKFLADNAKKEGVITTESGLQYRVISEGTGEKPAATDKVKVHYRGTTIDGNEFDSSFKRNQPTTFAANRVIKGWTEGLQLMSVGAKYEFFIPGNLAYGMRSPSPDIGPNETLIFEVELLEIVKPEQAK